MDLITEALSRVRARLECVPLSDLFVPLSARDRRIVRRRILGYDPHELIKDQRAAVREAERLTVMRT